MHINEIRALAKMEDHLKKIYLHIGTHKTGSTSLQRWLLEHEPLLQDNGYSFYHGQHIRNNHVELYLAAMRYDRDSFGKQSMDGVIFDEDYTNSTSSRVKRFLEESECQKVLLSTEGLSLLRHQDEIKRLRQILGTNYESATVIVALRNRADYLNSYRLQLKKKKGRKPSKDYWSALYVEDDTWLTDYDSLLKVYEDEFGKDNIHIIDYDEQMRCRNNIIPAFLEAIGFEKHAEVEAGVNSYADNQTLTSKDNYSAESPVRSVLRRLGIG
ncbi:hypothetical protein [Pseudomaricurvus sp. HS19]|uniref:hypothetical protein n=1 Tax=Pseudomaricurvus sp. HS19 TaxID=2692626 RepID=UPI0013698E11|nr:hypothetical protein [Pseudomaricurvus sp. HS19]MYM63412.1 hypothetical protein [Pseudomaricurvus sp. HS19]